MNSMLTVPRKAHKPKRAGSPRIPGAPWPDGPPPPGRSSPPPGAPGPEWPGFFSRSSVVMVGGPLADRGRIGLHHVVGLHAGDGVVIRRAVDLGDCARPVAVAGGRGRRPFEPVGIPGVVRGFRALEGAPQEIDQEEEL